MFEAQPTSAFYQLYNGVTVIIVKLVIVKNVWAVVF